MPEALARIRREPTLSAPVRDTPRQAPRAARAASAPAVERRFRWPRTAGGYAGALMCLALAGIVVNAVSLQKERHPAPLFAPEAPTAAAPASLVPVSQAPAPAPSPVVAAPKSDAVATASSKPADRGATVAAPVARKADPIAELLRSESAAEHAKTILAAQRALVKLGYDLQVDGSMKPAMIDALHDFEKNHGLPPTSEVTPRLIAKLNAAAR